MHTSIGHQSPTDLKFEIEHFKGTPSRESSLSSTPDGLSTPPATKKMDYFGKVEPALIPTHDTPDAAINNNNNNNNSSANNSPESNNTNSDNKFVLDDITSVDSQIGSKVETGEKWRDHSPFGNVIREIPKSPHLSKDFSPNGDRIRNSIRARRQERMLKQRSLLEVNSNTTSPGPSSLGDHSEINSSFEREDTPGAKTPPHTEPSIDHKADDATVVRPFAFMPLKRKRSRPYGEKGFIINMDDGLLSLSNVKNLDNCSDIDSSCDTSLNYIDVNHPTFSDSHQSTIKSTCRQPSTTTIIETTPTAEMPAHTFSSISETANNGIEKSSAHRNTLDEIKRQLNLCKSKLEALELADNTKTKSSIYPMNDCRDAHRNDISLASMHSTSPPPPLELLQQENGTKSHSSNLDFLFTSSKPKSPTKTYSMFSRLNPLSPLFNNRHRGKVAINETYPPANTSPTRTDSPTSTRKSLHKSLSPIVSPDCPEKPHKSTKLFRINDTPIFERRKIQSILPSKLFRRSDSDDNINKTYPSASKPAHISDMLASPKAPPRSNRSFRLSENDSENIRGRNGYKNGSNQNVSSDRTSPIRKYFTVNQSKILSKNNESKNDRSNNTNSDRKTSENDNLKARKNSKDLLTYSKYSYKKISPSTVQVHNSNAQNRHDIYENSTYNADDGRSKHIFVNYMDPSCSSSATHPITLQNKSSKFTTLFDYNGEIKKLSNNDSSLYRIKSADKSMTSNNKKPTLHTKVFRN